jgi:uncharacterized protein
MPYAPPPELATLSLSQVAELVAQRKLPPVDDWNPALSGDSEMRICADGRWFHQGGEITRPAMIRAFASLLRRDDDGQHFLVTPYEKLSIIVDDAPLMAVELRSEGIGRERNMAFRLNTDDLVILDAEHPMEMRSTGGPPIPYINVRGDIWAKLSRPAYYEAAEMALTENPEHPGLYSAGQYFAFGQME